MGTDEDDSFAAFASVFRTFVSRGSVFLGVCVSWVRERERERERAARAGKGDCPFSKPQSKAKQRQREREREWL